MGERRTTGVAAQVWLAIAKEGPVRRGDLRQMMPNTDEKLITNALYQMNIAGSIARSAAGYVVTESCKPARGLSIKQIMEAVN
jgi:hypothetical protein